MRIRHALLAAVTIAAGLAVHFHGGHLPRELRDKLGDVLWAMMVAFGYGVLVPRRSSRARGLAAMATCAAVEVSQLWHAPWLDALRTTPLGALTLGSGFDPRDLVAYAAGITCATLLGPRDAISSSTPKD